LPSAIASVVEDARRRYERIALVVSAEDRQSPVDRGKEGVGL